MNFLACMICLWAVSAAVAKDLKVATVDMRTLVKEYPGTYQARKKFDEMAEEKRQDLADSEGILSELQKELDHPPKPLSKKERKRKEKELEAQTQDYLEESRLTQDELDKRNQEMTRLLTGQIKDVIAGIAQKEGVDLVLDSNDAVLGNRGRDLTDEALRAFAGLKPDQTDLDSGNS